VRTVYLASPPFGTPVLARLIERGAAPGLVVTTPDRREGRGRKLAPSPLAELAARERIPVLRAESVREDAARAALAGFAPDVVLVASWGELLRGDFLALPRLAVLNVHPSLLPRHRGATPVQAALSAGDPTTGVSIQRVVLALDAGDVLVQHATPIGPEETAGELTQRLALLGGDAAAEALGLLAAGRAVFRPQDPALVTVCRKLTKESGRIDWTRPADELARLVRAMNPWPGAATALPGGGALRVLRARALAAEPDVPPGPPGSVREAGKRLRVACGQGELELVELQQAGKRALAAAEFLRGTPLAVGARLGVNAPGASGA
jgi:methionyl-tRNA formyltransferase